MGVVVINPRDCLNDSFSRNNLSPPHRQKKPLTNRRRRSPPRNQAARSHPPPLLVTNGSKKKNYNQNKTISSPVRILKRGEDIGMKVPDLTVEKPDLKPTRRNGSDPMKIPNQNRSMPFYAGPATSTSPPASEVPLPAFFAKKSVTVFKPTDATNDLIRILRLDIV